ncbi:S-layer protein domain-containing protein [Methanococcoides methylutens]|uniref:Carbohydrate-binding/sugar hydrolysis domain-containing protein n=1 Tax=Methanococcoides methylutens MM1 TaxID=1434104 RepID=A0A0E3STC8_METMT|nr:S-layer protein domain-containing protein [Methanococcoides methylutens]AKB85842.1 hypothetical protein MCMEM_1789 [Methanococcoides methylutens MM1]
MYSNCSKLMFKSVAFTFLLLITLLVPANAAVITVDDDGVSDYSSIQAAVISATLGDTIEVQSGIYYENVVLDKELFLKGIGFPLIDANGNGTGISVIANNCTIEGFNITESGTDWNGGDADSGIKIKSANNTILNNKVNSNQYGIFIFTASNNTIESNTISNNEEGIYTFISPMNFIDNNTLSYNSNKGIYISSSDNISVYNNTVSSNSYGIYLDQSANCVLEDNIVFSNVDGIWLRVSYTNALINNTVFENSGDGIYLSSSCSNTLTGNTLTSNHDGFYLYSSSTDNIFTKNIASNNLGRGYYIWSGSHHNILQNNFAVNNLNGIEISSSDSTKLKDNVVYDNTNNGIHISRSYNSFLANNNVSYNDCGIYLYFAEISFLANNNASYNDYGINAYGSTHGLLLKNNLIDNIIYNAYDTYGYSTWILNYYSDYTGTDSNNNNIGDVSYYLPPSGDSVDKYPSMQPWDNNEMGDGANFSLKAGENVDLYEGYSFCLKQTDVDGSKVWIELEKNGVFIDDKIITKGSFFDFTNNINGSEALICFGTVDNIFQGQVDSIAFFGNFYQLSEGNIGILISNTSDLEAAQPSPQPPTVIGYNPSTSISSDISNSVTFTIDVNQSVNVNWLLNGNLVLSALSVTTSSYTNNSAELGTHNLTAVVTNSNGSDQVTWDWTVSATSGPQITSFDPSDLTPESIEGTSQEFSIDFDQVCDVEWYIDGLAVDSDTGVTSSTYTNTSATEGSYTVVANATSANGSVELSWDWTVFAIAGPQITSFNPSDLTPESTEGTSQEFSIDIDQVCDVEWYIDGSAVKTESSVTSSLYSVTDPSIGTYTVTVNVSNANGEGAKEWEWEVQSNTYYSGDRIWDETTNQSADQYVWDYLTYSGFYYDLDTNEGSESMTIVDIDRVINAGDLTYMAAAMQTGFEYNGWGEYESIGFMGEKYLAGYPDDAFEFGFDAISLMSAGQLSKVLVDDDEQQFVYNASSIVLEEGYQLAIIEIYTNNDRVFVNLLKDGSVVDSDLLSSGGTYIYEKDLGGINDAPIIAVNFGEIFGGVETSAIFIDGIFQVSDDYEQIAAGTDYGLMEITSISSTKIEMENPIDINLAKGNIIDLMGDIKIVVADDVTLRFAPFTNMTEPGYYELRGTVAEESSFIWTPMNFEGLYYEIDDGGLSESLEVIDCTGRVIAEDNLVYKARIVNSQYDHKEWGVYNAIGLFGEKYVPIVNNPNKIAELLVDSNETHTLMKNDHLDLGNGYELLVYDFDVEGEKVWIQLFKDSNFIDDHILYPSTIGEDIWNVEKDVAGESDVVVLKVRATNVTQDENSTFCQIEGIWLIDWMNVNEISLGERNGLLEMDAVTNEYIQYHNPEPLTLEMDSTIGIARDLQIRVADSTEIRYYPFIEKYVSNGSSSSGGGGGGATGETYTMSLQKGWNLVSTPITPDTPEVTSIFGSNDDILLPVYTWNTASKQYYEAESLEIGTGYWVLVLNDTQVSFTGTPYTG